MATKATDEEGLLDVPTALHRLVREEARSPRIRPDSDQAAGLKPTLPTGRSVED